MQTLLQERGTERASGECTVGMDPRRVAVS